MGKSENSNKDQFEWVKIDPDLAEIIPDYLRVKKDEASELLNILEKKDFSGLQRFGHSLKGSGGGYGFDRLTDIGADIEVHAKTKDSQSLREKIEELKDYLERVRIKD